MADLVIPADTKPITEEERQKRIREFERLKQRLAHIHQREETTQEEFNSYIKRLGDHEICKYMTGIKDVLSVCNFPLFKCKFRGDEIYHINTSPKRECCRENMIKLRKLL